MVIDLTGPSPPKTVFARLEDLSPSCVMSKPPHRFVHPRSSP